MRYSADETSIAVVVGAIAITIAELLGKQHLGSLVFVATFASCLAALRILRWVAEEGHFGPAGSGVRESARTELEAAQASYRRARRLKDTLVAESKPKRKRSKGKSRDRSR